ncbi:MAG: glycine C-acetyltransferase [Bacteroidia bacterium]
MGKRFSEHVQNVLEEIRQSGLYKEERIIASTQGVEILLANGQKVLNFCANNYLGLSSHPEVIKAAHEALDRWGYGMSSVRFICGTQEVHKELEKALAAFLGFEDAILYAAAFDANGGVFEPLVGPQDAIISDALNHASLIDGIRLTKAQRYVYRHADMEDLEVQLKKAQAARFRIIATDGVFSMDGDVAPLAEIVALAEKYDSMVLVDDSHATGFWGPTGRGSIEYCGVMGKVDLVTGTLGKALGGAMGGFVAGERAVVELLRQRSRPYLFSNSLTPIIAGASLAVLRMLSQTDDLRRKLRENTLLFRKEIQAAGFEIKPGEHPIVPIMLYEATVAQRFAAELLKEGIYVIGFSYPVVPKGEARIRVQLSAAHEPSHILRAVEAFTRVGKRLGVLSAV